jgi:protein-S-isoprenylcysteine O-methyltransferase Ste14
MKLLVFALLYALLAFGWRSWRVYRQSGQRVWVLHSDDSAHGYVGRAFKVVMVALLMVVLWQAVDPAGFAAMGTMAGSASAVMLGVGWLLLVASLLGAMVAQAHMGLSWRIGIDETQGTALVTTGLFAHSRNPVFLFMRLGLLGFWLVLPHAATLAVLIAGELLMQVQVRLEEHHLRTSHGDDYAGYVARVRRWL